MFRSFIARVSQMLEKRVFGKIEIPVNRLEPAVTAAMLKEKTVKAGRIFHIFRGCTL